MENTDPRLLALLWLLIRINAQKDRRIAELEQTSGDYEEMAYQDALTGLPNKRAWQLEIETLAVEAKSGEVGSLCLVMIDFDDFRLLNDIYGHPLADELLKSFAARLRNSVKKADKIFRWGGDEFMFMARDVHNLQEVLKIAQRLSDSLVRGGNYRIANPATDFRLHLAIGVSWTEVSDGALDIEQLVVQADLAMRMAKKQEGSHIEHYRDSLQVEYEAVTRRHAKLEQLVREKLYETIYVPIVEAGSRRLKGFEVSVRDPKSKNWEADIRVIERLGDEQALYLDSLTNGAINLALWNKELNGSKLTLSVNASARQLEAPSFFSRTLSILIKTGFAPEDLIIELTERHAFVNPEQALRTMDQLCRLGVHIVLDDFTMGYNQPGRFGQLISVIEGLKVDKSCLRQEGSSKVPDELATALEPAKIAGIPITAEGVETELQASQYESLGFTHLQGWLFCAPFDGPLTSHQARRIDAWPK